MATVGERIKARRKELQWSQRELSARMGYSNHSTITRIEAGKVDLPQSRIAQFAEVLGVTPGHLMGWVDEATDKKNNAIVGVIVELRSDPDFLDLVLALKCVPAEKRASLKPVISALAGEQLKD